MVLTEHKKMKESNSSWIILDGFFDLIVTLVVYVGKFIKSIIGMFLSN